MTFDEVLDQVRELLQQQWPGDVPVAEATLSVWTMRCLAGVIDELIKAEHVAADEDGDVLVWTGRGVEGEKAKRGKGEKEIVSSQSLVPSPQPPIPRPRL